MDLSGLVNRKAAHRDFNAHQRCEIRDARQQCLHRACWSGVHSGRRIVFCDAHKAVLGRRIRNVRRVTS